MLMLAMMLKDSYLCCKCQLTEQRKQKYSKKNFECQIRDKKKGIRSESVLNQNTVKVFTDGSTLDERVGVDFLCRIPKQLPKTSIFPPWHLQNCVPGRSLGYFRSGKKPAFGKNAQSKYCCAG